MITDKLPCMGFIFQNCQVPEIYAIFLRSHKQPRSYTVHWPNTERWYRNKYNFYFSLKSLITHTCEAFQQAPRSEGLRDVKLHAVLDMPGQAQEGMKIGAWVSLTLLQHRALRSSLRKWSNNIFWMQYFPCGALQTSEGSPDTKPTAAQHYCRGAKIGWRPALLVFGAATISRWKEIPSGNPASWNAPLGHWNPTLCKLEIHWNPTLCDAETF